MDEPETSESKSSCPVPGKIRNRDASLITDHDDFDGTPSSDEDAYLSSDLIRSLSEESSNFRGDNFVGRDSSPIDMFNLPDLARFQTDEISESAVNLFPLLDFY